jgi:hypothetical protein
MQFLRMWRVMSAMSLPGLNGTTPAPALAGRPTARQSLAALHGLSCHQLSGMPGSQPVAVTGVVLGLPPCHGMIVM